MKDVNTDKLMLIVFFCKNENEKLEEIARMLCEKYTELNLEKFQELAAEQNTYFHGRNTTLLVAECEEYFQSKSKYSGGYTCCKKAIDVVKNQIVSMRNATEKEIGSVNRYYGLFTPEDIENHKQDMRYGLEIKYYHEWVSIGLTEASIDTNVSIDEICRILEDEPLKRGVKYNTYQIGKYEFRRRKEKIDGKRK